jgi:hypothetical protein
VAKDGIGLSRINIAAKELVAQVHCKTLGGGRWAHGEDGRESSTQT